ncbi:egg cell-secreted protein 1.3-like [Amborella trichopoda]|uniref:egg cell-secreted protein 1.3-like n=1 Tax=Amborella trichopoda TaxID=13333 RepID=UPI0005D3172E|nr:egg cell-secreted protein 1.3-like [Amborella trichopoda]|eukprot:XP_011624455.1 egg cell-secreted protein 1.3-like [Amborella trichopoda]
MAVGRPMGVEEGQVGKRSKEQWQAMLSGSVAGGLMECWDALSELRACSTEIILFFMNGEAYLGQGCCMGVRTITHHCWPSMFTLLGFTAEEGDILRAYCNAEAPPPALA